MRIPFEHLQAEIARVFTVRGVPEGRAERSATIFAEASLDGVPSHGLNMVPRYAEYMDKGWIDVGASPSVIDAEGFVERLDGGLGLGNTNAWESMERAVALSKSHRFGVVTLRNTNHWGRAGTYAWQAANSGVVGICWTNTESIMPPWGAREPKVGNNPLAVGFPRASGNVVLDMAMAQFSYGQLAVAGSRREELPLPGGYDSDGRLTRVPQDIEATKRVLPMGYWKGSGLAIVLDLLAASLSSGRTTFDLDRSVPAPGVGCHGVSQVFIAIDVHAISGEAFVEHLANESLAYLAQAEKAEDSDGAFYPGERTIQRREENLAQGVPVDAEIWDTVRSL